MRCKVHDRYLGYIWDASGIHLGYIWDTSGIHLGYLYLYHPVFERLRLLFSVTAVVLLIIVLRALWWL